MATRRNFLLGAAAGAIGLASGKSPAQTAWPSKTITIVVPFPAGGTTDMLARTFGRRMSEYLGQTVIVENRGGAGGSIGAESVARAVPDGHTLLFHNLTFSTTTISLEHAGRARHDIFRDFAPVALAANVPMVVVGSGTLPARDLGGFIGFARESKEALNYGSTGPGSVMNLAIEVLKRDAKLDIQHIPFRGAAPLVQELIAGRIAIGGDQLSSSLEFIKSGSIKTLATLSAQRIPLLPEVPTVRELGLPNMELRGWNGFFAPANTPDQIIQRANMAANIAAEDQAVRMRLADVGAETVAAPPQMLADVVRDQVDKVRPIIKELNLAIN